MFLASTKQADGDAERRNWLPVPGGCGHFAGRLMFYTLGLPRHLLATTKQRHQWPVYWHDTFRREDTMGPVLPHET